MGYKINKDGSVDRSSTSDVSGLGNESQSINKLSLRECYEILQVENNNQLVKQQYRKELRKWHIEENEAYEKCKSILDYKLFIQKYESFSSFYKMRHKHDALNAIEDLVGQQTKHSIFKCYRYLSLYPNGRYIKEVNDHIKRFKRHVWLIVAIILAIVGAVCIAGYKSGEISLSVDSLQFSKYGGEQKVIVSTKGSVPYLHWYDREQDSSEDWLLVSKDACEVILKTTKNQNSERIEKITIYAYSTFFGEQLRWWKKYEQTINVCQESGITTELQINHIDQVEEYPSTYTQTPNGPYTGSIRNKTFHHSSNAFKIKSDGVAAIVVNSEEDWIDIVKENDSIYIILARENKGFQRRGVVCISSGEIIKKIDVFQPSGYAKRLNKKGKEERFSLNPDGLWGAENTDAIGGVVKSFEDYKYGPNYIRNSIWKCPDISKFRCYVYNVECDGYWTLESVPSWIYAQLKNNTIYFWARPNVTGVERSATFVIRTSSGLKKYIIEVQPPIQSEN